MRGLSVSRDLGGRWVYRWAGFVCLFVLLLGCGGDSDDGNSVESGEGMRIVSLSPAITDILIDLELGEMVVGRDRWDVQLPDSVARVGDLNSLDVEGLVALKPTDVLFQVGERGIPPTVRTLADEHGWNVINVEIDTLDDVRRVVMELAEGLSFSGCSELRVETVEKADEILRLADSGYRWMRGNVLAQLGPILLLHQVEPISAFGPGSYLGDMLDGLGAENAIGEGSAWPTLDAEALVALDPWAIVIVRSGGGEPLSDGRGSVRCDPGPLGRLPLRAVRENRVVELVHPQVLLPGSSMLMEVPGGLTAVLKALAREVEVVEETEESGGGGDQ